MKIHNVFCDKCKNEIKSFRDEAEGPFKLHSEDITVEVRYRGDLCTKCAEKEVGEIFKGKALLRAIGLINDHSCPLR